jgi:L-fuculose-phosphate aldolase
MNDHPDHQHTFPADVSQVRKSLVSYGQRMTADRLAVGSAGNLSVRIADTVIMTPTGIPYDRIAETDICVLDADGSKLDGDGARSSEWPMHRGIYGATGAGAVVHTHSPFAVAVSTLCDELPAIHYSILRLGGTTVRVAPYATFGSDGLADAAVAALADRVAALLQNHGAVVYGATLGEAYDRAVLLEWLAEVYWRGRLAGSPRILSDAELEAVRVASRRHAQRSGAA